MNRYFKHSNVGSITQGMYYARKVGGTSGEILLNANLTKEKCESLLSS